MTEKVKKYLKILKAREYKSLRKKYGQADNNTTFKEVINFSDPLIFEHDIFGFNMGAEVKMPSNEGNVTPNYYRIISKGFDKIREEIAENIKNAKDEKKIEFGNKMTEYINLCFEVCERHKELAKKEGNEKLYYALENIPHKGAKTFYEALLFIKLSIYFLKCDFAQHIGLGRFDQYMLPFYLHDKEMGITDDEIFELIELFFISINFDTDLYFGIQQGDNGQSIMLGGFDADGKSMYNEFSKMCIKASL